MGNDMLQHGRQAGDGIGWDGTGYKDERASLFLIIVLVNY